ncbi:hypothetical protein ABT160_45890, partial [Streptomyces sp. NPDC001941]|uniref:hypothetical protein n=1 Tax=Streptomyces sp. NPDC001941 TaxID=3154659 RepID=UPI00332E7142
KGIVLLATPQGWRYSVLTVEGGMLCGRLDVPDTTEPGDAQAAATRVVTEIARTLHDSDVELLWNPAQDPGSWTAHVTLVTATEPAPVDTAG